MPAKKTTKKRTNSKSAKLKVEGEVPSWVHDLIKECKNDSDCSKKCGCKKSCNCNHTGGGIYCLGVIGAIIYYISTATGFWMAVWGIIKSLVWPAFLVYELLKHLGA